MSQAQNKQFNFEGNVEDESGGSYYVIGDDGMEAGPFGSPTYALTVRDRMSDTYRGTFVVEYEPP